MHQVAKAGALAITALGLSAVHVSAQGSTATPKVAALNAVLDYRFNWMRDTTAFDACSVYRVVGSPEQVASGLLPAFRERFAASARPCDDGATVDPRREMRVLVDSLSLTDTTARVYLTVRRGEQTVQEEYQLVNPTPLRWGVDRIVLSGNIRNYYLRPGTGPGTRP